jgi:hypothetical protein
MLHRSNVVVSILFAFATLVPIACAQQTQYPVPINIRVVDPSKAPVPGACVTVEGTSQDFKFSEVTNSSGSLPVVLRPGNYEITVLASGFTRTATHLGIERNSPPSIQIDLPVGMGGPLEITSAAGPDKVPMEWIMYTPCAGARTHK